MAEFKIKPVHREFVLEFCRHGNATQAYLKTHPDVTYNAAKNCAARLLKVPEIAELVEQHTEALAMKYNVEKENVIKILVDLAEKAEKDNNMTAVHKFWSEINRMKGNLASKKVEVTGLIPIQINLDLGNSETNDFEVKITQKDKPTTNELIESNNVLSTLDFDSDEQRVERKDEDGERTERGFTDTIN